MGKINTRRKNKSNVKQKIRNAQALSYYGIQFKSKLELYTYKKLKEANIRFGYEKHKFELLEKFDYNGKSMEMFKRNGVKIFDWQRPHIRSMSYLPDFADLRNKWIIECKGHPNDAFPIKWKMFKKYMNENHPGFTLYMPRNQKQVDITVQHIKDNDKKLLRRKSS